MTSPHVAIAAEGLGKKYLIGHESADQSRTLRDAISGSVRNFGRSAMNMMRGEAIIAGEEIEEFWALRNLDFTIERGDVIGVIGRNGAGKSTLLKVLSRITEPSEGRVTIRGRVASLLEVGTGFHPELSGRENIFLNGAILGMTRGEIRRKFDEIVNFAEVERFLDTPVKRYSSGMYVRLAFAVAAHLEPEILIVDEVLAVGDAEFQKKCLGKMHDVAEHGRTIIFVSHNMTAVKSLCTKGMMLEGGTIRAAGSIVDVANEYEKKGVQTSTYEASSTSTKPQFVRRVSTEFRDGVLHTAIDIASASKDRLIVNLRLRDYLGSPIGMASLGGYAPEQMVELHPGDNRFVIKMICPTMANGRYFLDLDLERPYNHMVDQIVDALSFEVTRVPAAHARVLQSGWGAGSVELAVQMVRGTAPIASNALTAPTA
jgi:lipopolysaccharide transport system ATP-binding protein